MNQNKQTIFLAEKIMGWKKGIIQDGRGSEVWWLGNGAKRVVKVEHYNPSEQIQWAWKLVEEMRKREYGHAKKYKIEILIEYMGQICVNIFNASADDEPLSVIVKNKEAATAITDAIFEAAGGPK